MNTKINQIGSFGIEYGGAWGTVPPDFKSCQAKPYLSFGSSKSLAKSMDESINGTAHSNGSVVTGIDVSNDISMVDRFTGLEPFFSWAYGFEQAVRAVSVFKVDPVLADPNTVDVYTTQGNSYKFLRRATFTTPTFEEITVFVFEMTVGNTPLVKGAGLLDGTSDIAYTDCSAGLTYEHTYEYANDRQKRAFTTAELSNLGTFKGVGDERYLGMSGVKQMGDYISHQYNMMCKSFTFSVSSASMAEWSFNEQGFDTRQVLSTSVVDLSLSCSEKSVGGIVNHFNCIVEIGVVGTPYGTNMTEIGATEVSIESSLPMQQLQTTKSKQRFEELWLEGKYEHTGSITIGRHNSQTFMDYRDNQTELHARIAAYNGMDAMQELIIKRFALNTAGAGDEDVPAEQLEMEIRLPCETHDYNAYIGAEVYNAPIVLRVISSDPYNYITGRNKAGTRYFV